MCFVGMGQISGGNDNGHKRPVLVLGKEPSGGQQINLLSNADLVLIEAF